MKKGCDDQQAVRSLVAAFETSEQPLRVVQVGANVGGDFLFDEIRDRAWVEAHLVEPVPWIFRRLLAATAPLADRIRCYDLAIAECDGRRAFYAVSERFAAEQPDAADWKKHEIGSLNADNLRRWVAPEYIVALEIDCLSPASFLSHANLRPSELNLLVVDAEGFDGKIVRAFCSVARPELIIYEHRNLPLEEQQAVIEELAALDYVAWPSGGNSVAARADAFTTDWWVRPTIS